MYGTIARLQVKPGMMEKLQEWGSEPADAIPGYLSQYVFQMDKDSNELYLVVIFMDKASYAANAQSERQHARYLEMRAMLAADPEWHDGEVIYAAETATHGL
jgi:quinol monooxygenase YgiN